MEEKWKSDEEKLGHKQEHEGPEKESKWGWKKVKYIFLVTNWKAITSYSKWIFKIPSFYFSLNIKLTSELSVYYPNNNWVEFFLI